MHGGGQRGGVKRARIEIIPLIDIIFFLLATFIMVSLSMTKNQGVQVALPTAASAASLGDQAEMEKAVTLTSTPRATSSTTRRRSPGAAARSSCRR
jgi:biopolymer transport protein ExbD